MHVRMYHPDHGYMHATDGNMKKTLESQGWVVDDGSRLKAKLQAKATEVDRMIAQAQEQRKVR
jgi:hypothetical protein